MRQAKTDEKTTNMLSTSEKKKNKKPSSKYSLPEFLAFSCCLSLFGPAHQQPDDHIPKEHIFRTPTNQMNIKLMTNQIFKSSLI